MGIQAQAFGSGDLAETNPYHLPITDATCVEDTIHLVGGHSVKEGRVQVCYSGEWHSICGDRWSEKEAEADVVCSSLGYSAELSWNCTLI